MKLKLNSKSEAKYGSEFEIDDRLLEDGSLQISVDSDPSCYGGGESVCITRDEAIKIIEHIMKVFEFRV